MSTTPNDKIVEIKLPRLGESISEATVLNWMVEEGDTVEKDQTLLEVATDKVDSEIPAPANGKILEIIAQSDEVVEVGGVLATLEAGADQSAPEPKTKSGKKSTPPKNAPAPNPMPTQKPEKVPAQPVTGKTLNISSSREKGRSFYSPLVHKIAKEHHISYEELARIPATGKDGRIRKSDIFRYLENGRPAQYIQTVAVPETESKGYQVPDLKFDKGKGRLVELNRMGKTIAKHMIYSKVNSPHVTAYAETDLTDMVAWRNAHKEEFQQKHGQKLTYTPIFVKAVARALKDFPEMNSSFDGDNIIVKEDINIGMGAALPDGNLIVPVIKNADQKDLPTLAKEVNELAVKAREGKLKLDETQGGTFTISNVGTFGSVTGTPIINQPEAAILATGSIKKRAEVMEYEDGDQIEIRKMMILALSFDHSFIGGKLAGSFLRRVAGYFEETNYDY